MIPKLDRRNSIEGALLNANDHRNDRNQNANPIHRNSFRCFLILVLLAIFKTSSYGNGYFESFMSAENDGKVTTIASSQSKSQTSNNDTGSRQSSLRSKPSSYDLQYAEATTKTMVNVSDYGKYVEVHSSEENVLPPGCDYAKNSIDMDKQYDFCVVGAGLSGTVFAERAANLLNEKVLIMDSRSHIGGNCYDFIDQKTGILRNQYGSHLFHTKIKRVWDYVTGNPNAPAWKPWYHQKFGYINASLYEGMLNGTFYVPIPVNILTVNRLFGLNIKTEEEMNEWLGTVQVPCPEDTGCRNAEEMAKSRVGKALYKAIFETYTIKQWNKSPKDMDASVTARIPVRSDFDPRYFADKWQALPGKGYTAWFEAMLDVPSNIDVVLNTDFFDYKDHLEQPHVCKRIVYTGPVDRYFEQQGLEKLEYRSIKFLEERHYNTPGYILPTPVVNYPGPETHYTRAIEYKHYLHQNSPHTLLVKESSSDEGEPYYPVPNERNINLYETYRQLATDLESKGQFIFVGRLANYKYFDMDKAIDNALTLFYQSSWHKFFVGEYFDEYRSYIDNKILENQNRRKQEWEALGTRSARNEATCSHPMWSGEFGMELRVMVPWAYYKSQHQCMQIHTKGLVGSKYMYFFSDQHTINHIWSRSPHKLPAGNPFQSERVHIKDFPLDAEWQAPPFKEFFRRPEIMTMLEAKPLVVIQNKYTEEWDHEPTNFMSVELLETLLDYLTPKYTILYKRHTAKKLADRQQLLDLGEKDIIRKKYPNSVVFYEDLQEGLTDPEDQNLLLFGLMSLSDRFLSVQGGTAVVSSYFGGNSTILIKEGLEIKTGEYGYFHRFSNATVVWKQTDEAFLEHVKSIM